MKDAIEQGADINASETSGIRINEWQQSIASIPLSTLGAERFNQAREKNYATAFQIAVGAMAESDALRRTRLEIVRFLVRQGADANAECPFFGDALQIAIFELDKEMTSLLLDSGANINAHRPSVCCTALQAAASIPPFPEAISVLELLLDRGADINAIGGVRGTALAAAARLGFNGEEQVRILLRRGAFANLHGGPQAKFVTPLHAAIVFPLGPPGSGAGYGHEPVVGVLVDAGARVEDIPKQWRGEVNEIIDPSSCCVQ